MRRVLLCLGLMSALLGLAACGAGGGGGADSVSSGGGSGGGAVTSSNISLPSSVQVVSAH